MAVGQGAWVLSSAVPREIASDFVVQHFCSELLRPLVLRTVEICQKSVKTI